MPPDKSSQRKAAWLAFGLVALGIVAGAVESPVANEPLDNDSQAGIDRAAEAARAYKQAASTLASLTAHPPSFSFDPSLVTNGNSKSIFSSFLPNLQGQGPFGSTLRILLKLHHQTTRRLSVGLGLGQEAIGIGSKRKDEEQRVKAIKVLDLLHHSVDLGNTDALYTLAKVSLFPPTEHFPANPKIAYDSFSTMAIQTGNATAQSYLAFFYATGYHGIVPVDQAKAQLYTTFAANGRDKGAQMALGYRYWSGIGTSEDCDRASVWYGNAAEQAMAKFLSGPPGGRTLPQTSTRLSDLSGGIYGPSASVASTGLSSQKPSIKAGIARAAGETWEDVIEYYQFNADRGEIEYAFRLGKIFYQGSIYASPGGIASGSEGVGAVPRNYIKARHYFLQIARRHWPHDPPYGMQSNKNKDGKDEKKSVGFSAPAAGLLGRMYLRGEGVNPDFKIARMWFERGAEYGDRECNNGLGIIYRDGLGIRANMKLALHYFRLAAGDDLAEAQVNLGKYHYDQGEIALAAAFFESATHNGSPFEAYYYLAEIQADQAANPAVPSEVRSSSCSVAVSFYKIVAERGVWGDDLLMEAERDWMSGTEQGKEIALLKWWIAAERGFEIAQNNLAFILDQDKSMLRLTRFAPHVPSNDTAQLALTQWTRAAGQRNIDALVKVGDYYYHGLGIPSNSGNDDKQTRLEKAASYYQSAADTHLSGLAMWNLGWMYENGIGVAQDFHLAKRHYDLALEINPEAYLPIMLSLGKLYVRSVWHVVRGGKDGLDLWNSDEEDKDFMSNTKVTREIEDNQHHNTQSTGGENGNENLGSQQQEYLDDDDIAWYMGKAKEDFNRRSSSRRNDDEDPVQWARERRNAEQERDNYFGPEDYFEGAMRNGRVEGGNDDDRDDFMETMLLVLLCLLVSVLIWVRTRIVERMRRDQAQVEAQGPEQPQPRQRQPQQQPTGNEVNGNQQLPQQQQQVQRDNGVFPLPGDPARDEWAILR